MPKKTRVRSTILTRFISIFVVITTPFLCLSLLSSWRNESLLHERILQDVERSTAAFAQKMELNYSHIFSIQQSLALDSDLVDLVRRGDKMTRFGWTQSVNRLKDKLRDYMTVSPYIKEMSLYLIPMEQVISGPYGSRSSYDIFDEAVRQRLDMLLETEGTALLDNNELVIFTVHHTGGRPDYVERYHMLLNFANGKTGIYDFAIAQYWSSIRSRYFMAQGSKGEMKDDEIWFLDKNYDPKHSRFQNVVSDSGDLVCIKIDDDVVYTNELLKTKGVGKNLGICNMLLNMKKYLETGDCPYPFASAMQDTYITQLFLEAGRHPFEPIASQPMPWQPKD